MKSIYIYFILGLNLFFLASCGSEKEIKESLKKEIIYPEELIEKLKNFPLVGLEFNLDMNFMNDSLKNHSKFKLSLDEVKFLSSKLKKDSDNESILFYINAYRKIEKAKLDEQYENYLSKLDIGMMKDANCYSIGRIEYGDSVAMLIWKIEFSSYEACPYFEGTYFFGTLIFDGKNKETLRIALNESSADAPMNAKSGMIAKIAKDATIALKSESFVKEEDSIVEQYQDKFDYKINSLGFFKKTK